MKRADMLIPWFYLDTEVNSGKGSLLEMVKEKQWGKKVAQGYG